MENQIKFLLSKVLLIMGSLLIGIAWFEQASIGKFGQFTSFLNNFPIPLLLILGIAWFWLTYVRKLWQYNNWVRNIVLFIMPFIFLGLCLNNILGLLNSNIMDWYKVWVSQTGRLATISCLIVGFILLISAFYRSTKKHRKTDKYSSSSLTDNYEGESRFKLEEEEK